MSSTKNIMLTGQAVIPTEPLIVQAGSLTAFYENGAIRYIKNGNVEVLRMIYSAVRDHNWGTVDPVIYDEKIEIKDDAFHITYRVEYRQNEIAFDAKYVITGSSDGILRFSMHGTALSDFKKNRIGFCILHPIEECAGQACRIIHPDGLMTEGEFPQLISPHQPFKNIKAMEWKPAHGISARLTYSGDVFEMEDQRNWIDASYKTYCTPLDEPFPVHVKKGQIIEQQVELRVQASLMDMQKNNPAFTISEQELPLPKIGVGASSLKTEFDDKTQELLRDMNFHHYRIDIDLADVNWVLDLKRELRNAQTLDTKVEAALHIHPDDLTSFNLCLQELKKAPSIVCIVVFNAQEKSTDAGLLAKVMPMLQTEFPNVLIGGGTDCFFTELNRDRTPAELVDFLTFSINPQVHAFDNASLTETLEAHRYVVESAQNFAGGKGIHVSPVTFKMRFNPNATGEQPQPADGELPDAVDPRQISLYGAAWTLGSIKYLAESGADFVTFFETIGWRGLMQGPQDSPLPDKFPAQKGDIFPMYQILKWVMQFQTGTVIPVRSSQPLAVDGLLLSRNGKKRFLCANYTLQTQTVELPFESNSITLLDENTVQAFIKNHNELQVNTVKQKSLKLAPYAVACIE